MKHSKRLKITTIGILLILIAILFIAGTLVERLSNGSGENSGLISSNESSESTNEPEESDAVSNDTSNGEEVSDDSIPPLEDEDIVISFLACPDNIIHPSVYYDAIRRAAEKKGVTADYRNLQEAEYLFSPIYENIADDIERADISYINVETLIGGNENRISGYPMFNSPEEAGNTLIDLGFDIYNLAHNHMLDSMNDKYLINCDKFFREKGKTTIGYYKDEAATENIVIIEEKGVKIALLAYTYGTNGLKVQKGSTTYIPLFNEALIRKQVAIAKELADVIIVSVHWGDEDTYIQNYHQRTNAQLLIDLGVDVIIGMHSHSVQPMSWKENSEGHKTLLTYSLGNFVSGMYGGINTLGGTLSFDIVKDGKTGEISIESPIFKPIVTHYEKMNAVASDDTGFRSFKIYYLEEYTTDLAAAHGVKYREAAYGTTLIGGKFSLDTLIRTVKEYIPEEFLSEFYKN